MKFPFEKGSPQATALAKWADDQIAGKHIRMENSSSHEEILRIQGDIKALRDIAARCRFSAMEIAMVPDDDDDKEDFEPIPVV